MKWSEMIGLAVGGVVCSGIAAVAAAPVAAVGLAGAAGSAVGFAGGRLAGLCGRRRVARVAGGAVGNAVGNAVGAIVPERHQGAVGAAVANIVRRGVNASVSAVMSNVDEKQLLGQAVQAGVDEGLAEMADGIYEALPGMVNGLSEAVLRNRTYLAQRLEACQTLYACLPSVNAVAEVYNRLPSARTVAMGAGAAAVAIGVGALCSRPDQAQNDSESKVDAPSSVPAAQTNEKPKLD